MSSGTDASRPQGSVTLGPPVMGTPSPQVVDFFSGCGGTSAGLRAAGMEVVAALDVDEEAAATFRANFPDARFFASDIRKLEINALDDVIDTKRSLVFCACAPCQPYSALRRTRSASLERSLLLTILPYVERHLPDAIVVENVPGMQRVPGASTWNRFRKALGVLGYSYSWNVLDSRDFGVPQRRRRLVLLASRHGAISLPDPSHGVGEVPFATVRAWIGHLPPLGAGETHPDDPMHVAGAIGELNLRRLRATPEGGGRADWPDDLWLNCHKSFAGHEDVYGRLRYDGCAPVLTTKCTDITTGRYGHPTQDRAISVREAACLQTFPEAFQFVGSRKSATRQIGNAVPVLLARALGMQISAHLARHTVES